MERDAGMFAAVDITDDFMFSYVMQSRDICLEVLRCLLPEWNVRDIQYVYPDGDAPGEAETGERPATQKALRGAVDKRGVRLDVYLDDGKTVYNIEMQTTQDPRIAQRARFYQAHLDIYQLDRGQYYDKLKPSFVIFICKRDPFGRGLYRYTFENVCREQEGLRLGDETWKLFFFTGATRGEIGDEPRRLLRYMDDTQAYPVREEGTALIQKIERVVDEARQSEDWRREYMTFQVRQREAELRGIQIGEARGEARGEERKSIEIAKKMLSRQVDMEEIAEMTGLSLAEVRALAKESLH